MAKPWVIRRKRLAGEAKAKYGRCVRWIGGVLYFSKKLIPVPDISHVPKPGRPVIGHVRGK